LISRKTALIIALSDGSEDLATELLSRGASVNINGFENESPLIAAIRGGVSEGRNLKSIF
jgi:hypothetical protein